MIGYLCLTLARFLVVALVVSSANCIGAGGQTLKKLQSKTQMYALIEWKDENLVNVYSLTRIISPRKEINEYKVGDNVKANFGGKVYEAIILNISGK